MVPGLAPSSGRSTAVSIHTRALDPRHHCDDARVVIHGDEKRKHEEMGFHEGWGKALDQLVAIVRKM
jgi:uncharacterized protein YndB with AHSA1/START domain